MIPGIQRILANGTALGTGETMSHFEPEGLVEMVYSGELLVLLCTESLADPRPVTNIMMLMPLMANRLSLASAGCARLITRHAHGVNATTSSHEVLRSFLYWVAHLL